MTLTRFACVACPLVAVFACSGNEVFVGGGDPLEREDVVDLPVGDANGRAATGAYLFTSFEPSKCQCRSEASIDACDGLTPAGDGLWFEQSDGMLEVRLFESEATLDIVVLEGGLNEDGSVRVGGVNTVLIDGQPSGQTINLMTGTLDPEDGGSFEWRYRAEAVIEDESLDCDVVTNIEVSWWDPASVEACSTDADCHPVRSRCSEGVCSEGALGQVCVFDNDCASGVCEASGVCGETNACRIDCGQQLCFDGSCQVGAEGDPCTSDEHCSSPFSCIDGTCGLEESAPCTGQQDCPFGTRCVAGVCQEGVEGDPCSSNLDCAGLSSCFEGTCQDGSEGDPCSSVSDCSAEAQHCVGGACQDGSAGDPCTADVDCDAFANLTCSGNVCM